jgi:hypothetical protein
MSQTLAQARANVRFLLDDQESVDGRWTDAQVNTAIFRAAVASAQILQAAGWEEIVSTANVTLTAGVATVPANDGIKAFYMLYSDGSLFRILPGNGANRSLLGIPASSNMLLEYYAKTAPPAGDGYTVEYGGVDINSPLVDQFTEYLAASDLKTVEAEANGLILQKLGVLEAQIRARSNPAISIAPATSWNSVGKLGTFAGSRWYRSSPTTITVYR